jgi:hypothetical protein
LWLYQKLAGILLGPGTGSGPAEQFARDFALPPADAELLVESVLLAHCSSVIIGVVSGPFFGYSAFAAALTQLRVEDGKAERALLASALDVCSGWARTRTFPPDWTPLQMNEVQAALVLLQWSVQYLSEAFAASHPGTFPLWKRLLAAAAALVTSSPNTPRNPHNLARSRRPFFKSPRCLSRAASSSMIFMATAACLRCS